MLNKTNLENSLLLAAVKPSAASNVGALMADCADVIDWSVMVETALAHHVTGILCKVLLDVSATAVPETIKQACRQKLEQQRSTNEAATQQLTQLLTKLEAKGIEAVPFKGLTLTMSAYRDISLRSFRDLDFMIHREHFDACLVELCELGYQHSSDLSPKQWQAFINNAGQDILFGKELAIEPHWAFAPKTLAFDIDYNKLWERVSTTSLNGKTILAFSPEDELLILCMHGSKHEWRKLKWIVDLSLFIQNHDHLNWCDIINRAETQGLSRIIIFALAIASRLVGATVPFSVLEWMEKDTFAIRKSNGLADNYFDISRGEEPSIHKVCYFHWSMRERHRDKLRYFFRTITRPRVQHFVDIAIPDHFFFLYFPYKLFHDYFALPVWLFFKALRNALRRLWAV